MSVLAGNRVSPVLTDVSQLLSSVVVLRTVAQVAVKPFGHPFKVTPKGRSRDRVVVEWGLLLPFLLIALATAGGMLANLGVWAPGRGDPGYALNMVWSLFNLAVMAVAVAACVEMPRPRQEERFAVNAGARLRHAAAGGAEEAACTVLDLSVTGVRLSFAGPVAPGDRLELELPGSGLALPFEAVRAHGGEISGRFLADRATRWELIALLYTGAFANEVASVAPMRTLGHAMRRILG
jgi:cellulose synthase (UDP-forming)